ncbi:KDPG and KHG aldolase [Clostridium sp. DL-VIII]|uniref:bifunctional 4-hydroxy-2-oxoglutarate aldolase/2-dehydro-3-deoxy-phosphogluconate aldolase n=1 Tax=Clostridium sp. DL-VIII TaxID=641107 RepID=UPI00023B08A8|nr:bifunctional 4-hydroxy-2-oxoglutarate aldolase/2-dehydro-3-deoxy-phosphogluconate aldolase [Clostridium sp. DL-VIII]EHJ01712.1 KDPG and KHG aldolase [Clostridium sp. DL-VIII]
MEIKDFPKVTVILRGYTYSQIRTVVKNLIGTELKAVEITMNTPDSISIIQKISDEFGDSIKVGAGTVKTYKEADEAIKAGATFLLSPVMLSKEIIDLCKKNNVISVPGAYTPTEVNKSFDDGADIVKVFPAGTLGTKFLSDIQAPLGKLPLMVVGGINAENVLNYFKAGASFAGIASGIFNKDDILNENEENIIRSIQYFESNVE